MFCGMNLYDYKMSLCALSPNGKESWKVIQDPRKDPDRHQNLTDSSTGHVPLLHKTSSKSVRNFWIYFVRKI